MRERDEYVRRIERAIGELRVRTHLARLEARDVGAGLSRRYQRLRDRLDHLGHATSERWDALREGVEASWHEFRDAYRDALAREQAETDRRTKARDTAAPRRR